MEELRQLCRSLKLVTYEQGDVVFFQGEVGTSFYLVMTGAVNGYVKSEDLDEAG